MKFANPAPLGLFGFATTTWLLSMLNAGWFPLVQSLPLMMATAFVFGGAAQFIAGLLEYPRGNTFGFVAFTSYGAFWFAFALYIEALPHGPLEFQGAFLVVWGVLTACLGIATLRLNRVLQLVFLTLTVAFILLGLSHLLPAPIGPVLHTLGGYVGMVTALLAAYQATAEVVNEVNDRIVMPI
jgi:succinate-acetate transporter protein